MFSIVKSLPCVLDEPRKFKNVLGFTLFSEKVFLKKGFVKVNVPLMSTLDEIKFCVIFLFHAIKWYQVFVFPLFFNVEQSSELLQIYFSIHKNEEECKQPLTRQTSQIHNLNQPASVFDLWTLSKLPSLVHIFWQSPNQNLQAHVSFLPETVACLFGY